MFCLISVLFSSSLSEYYCVKGTHFIRCPSSWQAAGVHTQDRTCAGRAEGGRHPSFGTLGGFVTGSWNELLSPMGAAAGRSAVLAWTDSAQLSAVSPQNIPCRYAQRSGEGWTQDSRAGWHGRWPHYHHNLQKAMRLCADLVDSLLVRRPRVTHLAMFDKTLRHSFLSEALDLERT